MQHWKFYKNKLFKKNWTVIDHKYLSLTHSPRAMIKVTVDTDPRGHLSPDTAPHSIGPLWPGTALLTLLMEGVAMELRDLVTGHSGESVKAVCVLTDDVLEIAHVQQLVQHLVGVGGSQLLIAKLSGALVLAWACSAISVRCIAANQFQSVCHVYVLWKVD